MNKMWYTKEVHTSFLEALDDIDFELKKEWFWIMSRIDIQGKLKEKLDKDIEDYMILWACNPGLASEALDYEYEIGLLLPCNIIVYTKNSKVFVSSILPTQAMSMIENKGLEKLAKWVEEKLKKAIDSL